MQQLTNNRKLLKIKNQEEKLRKRNFINKFETNILKEIIINQEIDCGDLRRRDFMINAIVKSDISAKKIWDIVMKLR